MDKSEQEEDLVNSALERYAEHFQIERTTKEKFDPIGHLSKLEKALKSPDVHICILETNCKCDQDICTCVGEDYVDVKYSKLDIAMNNKFYVELDFSRKVQTKKNLRIFTISSDGEDVPLVDIIKSENMFYIYGIEGEKSVTYDIDEIKIAEKKMTIIIDYMTFDVDV